MEFEYSFDEIKRSYRIEFDVQPRKKIVGIEIIIAEESPSLKKGEQEYIKAKFDLSYFDFPLINNTRLSHDQRFALAMKRFGKYEISFSGIVFPAEYVSLRDRPFVDEIVQRLKAIE